MRASFPFLLYRGLLTCVVALVAMPAAYGDEAKTPDAPGNPPPAIVLNTRLVGRNTPTFARRLSSLLGVEVRLPRGRLYRLAVPAGEWTATEILNRLAGQIEDGSWELVYRFSRRNQDNAAVKPVSKLPPMARVTLSAADVSYRRAIDLVEDNAACVIEAPEKLPAGRFRLSWQDTPVERALQELAALGHMEVVPTIVFDSPEDRSGATRQARDEAKISTQAEQQAQAANYLGEAYGQDPYDADFPWDNIDQAGMARTIARDLDISPTEADLLIERVRMEAQTRAGLQ